MERKPNKKVIAFDPSMTAWGYSVFDAGGKIVDCGCIKTQPESKKRRIRKGDDTVRRVHELNLRLIEMLEGHNVALIVSEQPHGSQNASAAVMIGIVIGIVQTLSDSWDIPVEWYSEMDAKKRLLGKKAATKQDMVDRINSLYKVPWYKVKYIDEAIADSIAIYHTALTESNIIKMLKG